MTSMEISNVYDDARRAEAYARLEFPGTYYLAYRDVPGIIREHVKGKTALDFGCGTGRSTRFLESLGLRTTGVDIAPDMIAKARELDPRGDYRLIGNADLSSVGGAEFGLILSAFTFDNIPTMERKVAIFRQLRDLLSPDGIIINLVSAPEIYTHEWASFSTKDFPENRFAKSGDKVRIIITATDDKRPVEDIVWSDGDYREAYTRSGLEVISRLAPLAKESEPYEWVNETRIAPWIIYVLRRSKDESR